MLRGLAAWQGLRTAFTAGAKGVCRRRSALWLRGAHCAFQRGGGVTAHMQLTPAGSDHPAVRGALQPCTTLPDSCPAAGPC